MFSLIWMIACGASEPASAPAAEPARVQAPEPASPPVEDPATPAQDAQSATPDPAAEPTLTGGSGNKGNGSTGKAGPKGGDTETTKQVGTAGPKTRTQEPAQVESGSAADRIEKQPTGEPAVNK